MTVSDDLSFELMRVVDAPVDRVWLAWSDADLVKRWWGPAGFSCTRADIRLAEGSSSVVTMRSEEGHEFHNLWTYTVVEPMERIEFHSQFCDPDGNPVRPSDMGMPAEIPERVPHVVTLQADGETTVLTVQEFGYAPGPILDMSKAGQEQCLDQLADVAAEA
jgi:uncharacterized protein YndB with AHSA1/START domain